MDGHTPALKLAGGGPAKAAPVAPPPPPVPSASPPCPAPPPPQAEPPGLPASASASAKQPPHAQAYQRSYHPAGRATPPPMPAKTDGGGVKDLGWLGKTFVWFLAIVLFGGGLGAWFYGYTLVEVQIGEWSQSLNALDMSGTFEFGYLDYLGELDNVNEIAAGRLESAGVYIDAGAVGSELSDRRAAGDGWRFKGWGTDWPDLRMTGTLIGAHPEDGSVILDGIVVAVGSQREGVRVIQVQSDAAELEYNGERRWIISGQKINQ